MIRSASSAWSTCSSSSSNSLEDDEVPANCFGINENSVVDTFILLCHELPLNSVNNELLSLQTGHEKVDYVIKLLEKNPIFKEFVNQPNQGKCNEESEKLRIRGNGLYRDRNYSKALKYYTRSIAFAENESLYLALAYGNRSALFFEKRYYQEAIKVSKNYLICCL